MRTRSAWLRTILKLTVESLSGVLRGDGCPLLIYPFSSRIESSSLEVEGPAREDSMFCGKSQSFRHKKEQFTMRERTSVSPVEQALQKCRSHGKTAFI